MSSLDSQSLTKPRDNWTHTSKHFYKPFITTAAPNKFCNTATMARDFSDYTSIIFFVLLGLAACIMLATSAPSVQRVHVRQATSDAVHLNSGVHYSISDCRLCFCSR